MNNQLQEYARAELKKGLAKLPLGNQLVFKRMYSHKNLDADINSVVDAMPENKLDWAMQQVQGSLDELTS
jgi:hypothetical protein